MRTTKHKILVTYLNTPVCAAWDPINAMRQISEYLHQFTQTSEHTVHKASVFLSSRFDSVDEIFDSIADPHEFRLALYGGSPAASRFQFRRVTEAERRMYSQMRVVPVNTEKYPKILDRSSRWYRSVNPIECGFWKFHEIRVPTKLRRKPLDKDAIYPPGTVYTPEPYLPNFGLDD